MYYTEIELNYTKDSKKLTKLLLWVCILQMRFKEKGLKHLCLYEESRPWMIKKKLFQSPLHRMLHKSGKHFHTNQLIRSFQRRAEYPFHFYLMKLIHSNPVFCLNNPLWISRAEYRGQMHRLQSLWLLERHFSLLNLFPIEWEK